MPASRRNLILGGEGRAATVFNFKVRGVRLSPEDVHGVDRDQASEVNNNPLCVLLVIVACEVFIQIRVALPERVRVAVIKTRVTVIVGLINSVSAARETVTVADRDVCVAACDRCPVALLSCLVAPTSMRIPVPGFDAEFRAKAIGEWLETRR